MRTWTDREFRACSREKRLAQLRAEVVAGKAMAAAPKKPAVSETRTVKVRRKAK